MSRSSRGRRYLGGANGADLHLSSFQLFRCYLAAVTCFGSSVGYTLPLFCKSRMKSTANQFKRAIILLLYNIYIHFTERGWSTKFPLPVECGGFNRRLVLLWEQKLIKHLGYSSSAFDPFSLRHLCLLLVFVTLMFSLHANGTFLHVVCSSSSLSASNTFHAIIHHLKRTHV